MCFTYTERFNMIYFDVTFNKFHVPSEFIFFQELFWE